MDSDVAERERAHQQASTQCGKLAAAGSARGQRVRDVDGLRVGRHGEPSVRSQDESEDSLLRSRTPIANPRAGRNQGVGLARIAAPKEQQGANFQDK